MINWIELLRCYFLFLSLIGNNSIFIFFQNWIEKFFNLQFVSRQTSPLFILFESVWINLSSLLPILFHFLMVWVEIFLYLYLLSKHKIRKTGDFCLFVISFFVFFFSCVIRTSFQRDILWSCFFFWGDSRFKIISIKHLVFYFMLFFNPLHSYKYLTYGWGDVISCFGFRLNKKNRFSLVREEDSFVEI